MNASTERMKDKGALSLIFCLLLDFVEIYKNASAATSASLPVSYLGCGLPGWGTCTGVLPG